MFQQSETDHIRVFINIPITDLSMCIKYSVRLFFGRLHMDRIGLSSISALSDPMTVFCVIMPALNRRQLQFMKATDIKLWKPTMKRQRKPLCLIALALVRSTITNYYLLKLAKKTPEESQRNVSSIYSVTLKCCVSFRILFFKACFKFLHRRSLASYLVQLLSVIAEQSEKGNIACI